MDFTKIFQSKGLKPKNKDHANIYECCDLTKKVYPTYMYYLCLTQLPKSTYEAYKPWCWLNINTILLQNTFTKNKLEKKTPEKLNTYTEYFFPKCFFFENVKCKKYVICLEFTKETAAYLSLLLHFLKLEGYFLCPKAKQLDWNRLKDQLIKK